MVPSWSTRCSQTFCPASLASAPPSWHRRQMDHTRGAYRSTRAFQACWSPAWARVIRRLTDGSSRIGVASFGCVRRGRPPAYGGRAVIQPVAWPAAGRRVGRVRSPSARWLSSARQCRGRRAGCTELESAAAGAVDVFAPSWRRRLVYRPRLWLEGEGHVEDARGGEGEGELAVGAGVAAGAAGDRVDEARLGEVGEALDGDLPTGQLQVDGGQVERVVSADGGQGAGEDPHLGGAGGVVQDAAEDSLVAEATLGEELALLFVGDQVDDLGGGGAGGGGGVGGLAGLGGRGGQQHRAEQAGECPGRPRRVGGSAVEREDWRWSWVHLLDRRASVPPAACATRGCWWLVGAVGRRRRVAQQGWYRGWFHDCGWSAGSPRDNPREDPHESVGRASKRPRRWQGWAGSGQPPRSGPLPAPE